MRKPKTLYYDDPAVYPVNIEKLGNDQWKVTFARR
jgi:hypothetical protein